VTAAAGAIAGAVFGWSLAAAAARGGWSATADNVWQRVARDGEVLPGSHWHSHWLSLAWFGCLAALAVRTVRRAPAGARPTPRGRGVAWVWFASLTLAFGLSWDTIASGRYLGHQARELFTHALVTTPLAVAALAMMSRPGTRLQWQFDRRAMPALASVVLIPLLLGAGTVARGGLDEVQWHAGWAGPVGAHFFEHVFDYVFVTALVVVAASTVFRRS
jgi:hypothetical protein